MWFVSPCSILFASVSSARLNSFYLGRTPVLLVSGFSEDKHDLIYSRCWITSQLFSNPPSPLCHGKSIGPSVPTVPRKPPWSLSQMWHLSSPNHKFSIARRAFSSRISECDSLRASTIPYPSPNTLWPLAHCFVCTRSLKSHWFINSGFYGLWESSSVVVLIEGSTTSEEAFWKTDGAF